MELRERTYDIDALWQLICDEENNDKRFELIEGELFQMSPPGELHGHLAGEIYFYLRLFDSERKLGIPTVETGYYPQTDRRTLLSPDVAFRRVDHTSPPLTNKWAPQMPDLAVEVISPSNAMAQVRRKAAIYLSHGTQLVWIVIPDRKGIEVCQLGADGDIQSEFIGAEGAITGEPVLPGFRLELSSLFS